MRRPRMRKEPHGYGMVGVSWSWDRHSKIVIVALGRRQLLLVADDKLEHELKRAIAEMETQSPPPPKPPVPKEPGPA